ncbi:MAG: phosphoribosylformylglycinamidine synthase subunit PurQ [Patescibacteria group bacterium]
MRPIVLVPWFPGTNCHPEMAHAFELAGARAEVVPLQQLIDGRRGLHEADLIGIAGGFSWGDHLGAGRVAAVDLQHLLRAQLALVMERGIPILGVCNGFQILVASGLLPGPGQKAILDLNLSARFEHWGDTKIHLHQPRGVQCIWIEGLDGMEITLPVAHAEGRLVYPEGTMLDIVATYGSQKGSTKYPASPSGSPIAGICDSTGTIMGMMPHPERRVHRLLGDQGWPIFRAGVKAVM